ncbi:hypothetical protein HPB50_015376 [Hyalomma asiaticum]|uniref:Uncharacterized protein n=1 Tax=Hyalomma asiaticum TaxID=266040 RepID=A0ACB7T2U0_HYAAI|nr:hypothetical protein HPB50_015376 [Hyalomma asiaticum]
MEKESERAQREGGKSRRTHRSVNPRHWRDPREECQACERSHNRIRHDERPASRERRRCTLPAVSSPPQETPDVTTVTESRL